MLINLTPHALAIHALDGTIRRIGPAAPAARCEMAEESAGAVDGIAITRQRLGRVTGLPHEAAGTSFIVSRIVAEATTDRGDLLFPGPAVRDEEGTVVGCMGLSVASGRPPLSAELEADLLAAGRFLDMSSCDMSDATWHLGTALTVVEALGHPVPALHQPSRSQVLAPTAGEASARPE